VTDLQWDRLSAVYMLVAYNAFMSLWDTEACTEVHVFERQSTGISCIGASLPLSCVYDCVVANGCYLVAAWMDWTAGNFISANAKTGKEREG
jgi:hypothetical protein